MRPALVAQVAVVAVAKNGPHAHHLLEICHAMFSVSGKLYLCSFKSISSLYNYSNYHTYAYFTSLKIFRG